MTTYRSMPGYERYEVGSDGSIWSLDYRNTGTRHRIKCFSNNRGYIGFVVSIEGGFKRYHAHRVVAQAFIDNPSNLPQVNHKNGVRDDNRVENLEWVSISENHKHAFRELGKKAVPTCGERSHLSKLSSEQVRDIQALKGVKSYDDIAKLYSINRSHAWRLLNGKAWKHLVKEQEGRV